MWTYLISAAPESATTAGISQTSSQISAAGPRRPRRQRRAAGLLALALVGGGCGSSLQKNIDGGPDGAQSPDSGADTTQNPDSSGNACVDIQQAYADALKTAQECTVGASGQCSIQVQSGFWCNCTTWVNGGADGLAAIVSQYQAAGCRNTCNGTCVQPQSLTCLADTTSSTGGRCKLPMLVNLTAANDGQTLSLSVGYEIDILLSGGPIGYEMNVNLSGDSNAATVLEIAIPAGAQNPGGPTYLYRLKALSSGSVVVQIAHSSPAPDASLPAYMITLNIS